jgi:hypothetical protein
MTTDQSYVEQLHVSCTLYFANLGIVLENENDDLDCNVNNNARL